MTSPLPSPTFKTSARTNEAIRSLSRKMAAQLDRTIVFDDLIYQCVALASKDENALGKALSEDPETT